jgi:hypothetical protein
MRQPLAEPNATGNSVLDERGEEASTGDVSAPGRGGMSRPADLRRRRRDTNTAPLASLIPFTLCGSCAAVDTVVALNLRFAQPSETTMAKKERIVPPSKKVGTQASGGLKKGSSVAARAMADLSVAKRQGAKRPPGK